MKVFGLIVVLAVSIFVGILYWQSRTWDSQTAPQSYQVMDDLESKGIYAPDEKSLSFTDIEGKTFNLDSFKGKILILSFWATWCEPCVEEFPSFIKLMDAFPDKVVVLAISQDEKATDVKEFVSAFKGYRQNLILTLDPQKKLSQSFAVDRLPEGFVFDAEGLLKKKIIGIQDWASPDALRYFEQI